MLASRPHLDCLLSFFASGLLLLLATRPSAAGDLELCTNALADPDLRIPACTQVLDHPGTGANLAEIYNLRGAAKVRKGYLDDAIADFTSALNQNPKFADALKNRGITRQMQGNYDAAIADFNQALRLNDKSPELYNARGTALFSKEEYSRAISDFGKAISIDPKYVKAYINRGLAYHFTRQLDLAIADYGKVISLAPNEPLGYMNRASARMDKAGFKGAIADYNEAIRLDPKNAGAYTRRGEAWRLQGDFAKSLADHNKSIELGPSEEAYNNRALALKDQGKLEEAIADCDEAMLLNPKFYLAWANRGMLKRLKGDLWGSLNDLNEAVELNPHSPIALTFRGDTLRESGDFDRAMKDFNEAILILPDFAAAFTGRGLNFEKMGDLAKAKADFEKAASLSADVDAGLARPAQKLAKERLAALAEEARRAKEAALRAEQEARDKAEKEKQKQAIIEATKLEVPEDIQQALDHRGHALLIGVSDYDSKSGWTPLPNVKRDLDDLKDGLAPYFETVEAVLNPTAAELREKMSDFLLGQWNKPGERLFIYYSGHGFTAFNETSRDSDGYITGRNTPGTSVVKAISFFEVDSWSRQTRARHVLMVFDSCFSGSLFQTMGPEPGEPAPNDFDNVRTLLRKPMRYYITAGRQNEEVAADSTFATLLLRGLRGEADKYHQGIVSAEELGNYLFHKVPEFSPRPQTPQYKSIGVATLSEGQFFFLTERAAAAGTTAVPRAPKQSAPAEVTAAPSKTNGKTGSK